MKKTIILICTFLVYTSLFSQYYYYYYNEKPIPLHLNVNYLYVASYSASSAAQLSSLIGNNFEITLSVTDNTPATLNQVNADKAIKPNVYRAEVKLENSMAEGDYLALIKQLNTISGVDYVAPCFLNDHNKKVDISHLFYVKLKVQSDLNQLQAMAQQTKSTIIGQISYLSDWYVLSCDKNALGNTMELANRFYETGKFAAAEPDFFNNIVSNSDCTTTGGTGSDPDFSDQWGLQNTGQNDGHATGTSGIDICACPAWGITTGSSGVIVAVVDDAQFDTNHPDMAANVHNPGYDAATNIFISSSTPTLASEHAINCAGIIAAVQNNSAGISGVAPTSQIMPVANEVGNTSVLTI